MPRSPLHRFSAALMAVWFALAMTVGVPMHRCPMHDGLMGTLAMGGPQGAGMGGMAMGGMPGHAHDDAPAQPAGHHQQCTCVGTCACCQAPAMVVAARVALVGRATPARLAHPRPPATAPAIAASHRLPFANGPPTSPHTTPA